MEHSLIRRALAVWATVALVIVSIASLAHTHTNATSTDQSYCTMCMATHTATHAVVASVFSVQFTAVRIALLVRSKGLDPISVHPRPIQDRAPPQI
jgi:hypothetical protein